MSLEGGREGREGRGGEGRGGEGMGGEGRGGREGEREEGGEGGREGRGGMTIIHIIPGLEFGQFEGKASWP